MQTAADLTALLPAYREQYYALEPDIEKKVRTAQAARGMFYSGAGSQEEVEAKNQLLAQLASASAQSQVASEEAEKNRQSAEKTARSQALGSGIAAGAGGLAALAPLMLMEKMKTGAWPWQSPPGASVSTTAKPSTSSGGGAMNYLTTPQSAMSPGQLGMGATGGLLGYKLSQAAGGSNPLGSGLGGALGYGLGAMSNPFYAGLGALTGALAGGVMPSRWFKI
jgi:hypothetical protein